MSILDLFRRSPAKPPAPRPGHDLAADPEWVKATAIEPASMPGVSGFLTSARLPKRGTRELLFAYDSMPYVRQAIGKIASSAAALPLGVYTKRGGKKSDRQRKAILDEATRDAVHGEKRKRLKAMNARGDLDEITEHPLPRLLRKPCPGIRGRTLLFLTFAWLDLVGDAFWIYNTNAVGMPTEIFPVPPHWVAETPSRQRPFYTVRIEGAQFEIPASNMLWFKDPSLENPYGRGSGIGHALSDEMDIDENAAKHVSSFFFNRAMPDMLVSVEGADDSVLLATKAKFEQDYRGIANAYRTAFLNGKVQVSRLDTTFRDMNLVELRKFSGRDVVIQALGLSPEMLGILDNSNRATITEARAMFAENVLAPRISLVEEVLQEFAGLFDERLIVAFQDPQPDDLDFLLKARQANESTVSVNEWRTLQGLDPIEGGDVYFVDPMKIPVESFDELDDPSGETATVDPALAGGATAVQDTALNGAQVTSLLEIVAAVAAGTIPKGTAKALIIAAFPGISPEEVNRIVDPIEVAPTPPPAAAPPGRAPVPEPEDEDEDEDVPAPEKSARGARIKVDPDDFDADEFLDDALRAEVLGNAARETAEEIADAIGAAEASAVGAAATWDVNDPLIREFIDNTLTSKINGLVDETTRADLKATLLEGMRAGEGVDDIAKRVTHVFDVADTTRARVIARTEVVSLANRAVYSAHSLSGVVHRRQWVPTPDDRARDTHKPGSKLAGQVRGLDEKFESGSGATALHPGDFGVAEEDIQCRCTTVPLIGERDLFSAPELDMIQRDFEARIADHERRFTRALRSGFDTQRADVLRALRALF